MAGLRAIALCAALWMLAADSAVADIRVGVSWSNFQEERWKTDERALRAELERLGARYLSSDAQSSSEKQLADVESLLARGVDALLIVAHDADAIVPAVIQAQSEGIPVIAYDRLIELPGVFYVSFDNVEVGRLQAREILARRPRGRYVFIKGSAQDPNSDFVHAGQREVLDPAIARGEITIAGDQYIDGWLPELAQRVMEQILTSNANAVDAVVCSNDGMAGGVSAALLAQGMEGIPLSGQDGDHAALNRIARGLQTVSVWKDARELGRAAARASVSLAEGLPKTEVEGASRWSAGPRGLPLAAILLKPIPVTRDRLELVIESGWAPRASVCRGVNADDPPPACVE